MLHKPVFVWVLGLVALQAFEQLFHVQYLEQLHRLLPHNADKCPAVIKCESCTDV